MQYKYYKMEILRFLYLIWPDTIELLSDSCFLRIYVSLKLDTQKVYEYNISYIIIVHLLRHLTEKSRCSYTIPLLLK